MLSCYLNFNFRGSLTRPKCGSNSSGISKIAFQNTIHETKKKEVKKMAKKQRNLAEILRFKVGLSGNHSADEFTGPSANKVASRNVQEALEKVKKAVKPWDKLYYGLVLATGLSDENFNRKIFEKGIKESATAAIEDVKKGQIPPLHHDKLLKIAEYFENSERKDIAYALYKFIAKGKQ